MRQAIVTFFLLAALAGQGKYQQDSSQVAHQLTALKEKTAALQVQVDQVLSNKKQMKLQDMIPWILTGITIVVSALVYRREVSYRNIAFVTESNKMKITDPSLWAFYDTYKQDFETGLSITQAGFRIQGAEAGAVATEGTMTIAGSGNILLNGAPVPPDDYRELTLKGQDLIKIEGDFSISLANGASILFKGAEGKKLEGKIRAYSYFKLNSFELVFNANKVAGASNTAWEDYMITSIVDSSFFYEIVQKESDGYVYTNPYKEKLKDFIVLADLCKGKDAVEIARILESKKRILLAYRSGLIRVPCDFSGLHNYLD